MAAAMGGIDALAFTGGVGENSAQVRAATCAAIGFLGVEIDEEGNDAKADRVISSSQGTVSVVVLEARRTSSSPAKCGLAWTLVGRA